MRARCVVVRGRSQSRRLIDLAPIGPRGRRHRLRLVLPASSSIRVGDRLSKERDIDGAPRETTRVDPRAIVRVRRAARLRATCFETPATPWQHRQSSKNKIGKVAAGLGKNRALHLFPRQQNAGRIRPAQEFRFCGKADRPSPLHEGLVELHLFQTVADLFGVGATVESGDAKITFAFAAETAARSDHHLQFIQHPIEHLPTR